MKTFFSKILLLICVLPLSAETLALQSYCQEAQDPNYDMEHRVVWPPSEADMYDGVRWSSTLKFWIGYEEHPVDFGPYTDSPLPPGNFTGSQWSNIFGTYPGWLEGWSVFINGGSEVSSSYNNCTPAGWE